MLSDGIMACASYLDLLPPEILDLITHQILVDWRPPTLPGVKVPSLILTAHCCDPLLYHGEAQMPSICHKRSTCHGSAMYEAFRLHNTTVLLYGFDSDALGHLIRELDYYGSCPTLKNAQIYFWNCNTDLTLANLVRWAFLCHRFRGKVGPSIAFSPTFCGEKHSHRRQEQGLLRDICHLTQHPNFGTDRPRDRSSGAEWSEKHSFDMDISSFAWNLQFLILEKRFPAKSDKYRGLLAEVNDRHATTRIETYWRKCKIDAPIPDSSDDLAYGPFWDLDCTGKSIEERLRPRPCTGY